MFFFVLFAKNSINMRYFKNKKRHSFRELSYKILIFVATVAVIVYFMPRGGKFSYQFDIDKPWRYGQLMATFDFPIYKDEQVVQREQDSLLAQFHPYYQWDREVEEKALQRLEADYASRLKVVLPSPNYLRYIKEQLVGIYKNGILSTEELDSLREEGIPYIMMVDEKIARQQQSDKVYSVKSAYHQLLTGDTLHFRPDILRRCSLNEYLSSNLVYDKVRSESAKAELLDNYSWASGIVQSGQKIIDRGEIVNKETYNILKSLQKESIKRSESAGQQHLLLGGQILYVSIFILCFMLYLELFRKDYYKSKGDLALLFAGVVVFCVVTGCMVIHSWYNAYMVPYAMLPIVIRVFLDSRTAFLTHVVAMLICSVSLRYPHEFILLQLAAGLVAIFSVRELSQRSQLFQTAALVTATYAVVYFAFELITENNLSKMNVMMYIYFLINGVLLLVTYPLLFAVEKTFGFTSNVTLVELSNINTPLLRRMAETVPGTFQHSMQVANLATAAANSIGANAQLVRTGALYHDIGKMEHPVFFTENQSGGINPHKRLTYEQSAQVVISHVTDGLKLAEKFNLPAVLRAFISTHHGRGKTKYFYVSWMNEHPGETPNEAAFTYPGPNPQTKEQAILMMADSVEAASRSLSEYTEEAISCLVDKIVDGQLAEGFFKECPITFKEISIVKGVFKDKLKTMYHTRISYPELKKDAKAPAEAEAGTQPSV